MDFFKTFFYLFGRNFRKLVFSILFIILLTFSFFLILSTSNSVSATSFTYVGVEGSAFSSNDSIDINNTFNNYKGNYDSYVCSLASWVDGLCHMFLFNSTDTSIVTNLVGSSFIRNSTSCQYKEIILRGNGVASLVTETTGIFTGYFGYSNSLPWVYGNVPIYNNDSNGFWCPSGYTDFVPPALYPNANSDQTPLTSGNFIFFIVKPNSVPITESIQLDFADLSSDNNGDPIVQEITLNRDSAFFQFTNIDETEYQYVITARFLDWFQLINGKSYRAILAYFDENHNYQSIIYDWTMNIDSSQQQIIADTTQQNIDKGIQDINGYLNNQDFDESSIINNIPSVTINSATDNLLDLLFDSMRTAFTSTTPINFEFTIPNSNGQKIVIPSNYISSHLPSIIITLIQTFYWYIIARYILKDAWHTIDRMRQGTYYTGAEGDIKTEVL